MSEVVQGLLFRARSNTQGATRDLRGIISIMADLNGALSLVQRGLRGMTLIFREGVGASIEQEKVFLRLDRALQGLGTSYEENQERLSGYFAEVQRTTRFGDDATAAVMARVATSVSALDVGVDQLETMTSLVLDYSEATGRDAVAASEALSKAFGGNVEALAEMLPSQRDVIRELAKIPDAAERSAAAVALLSAEFGGAAANIDPLELALARINNGFGDIREALGDLVRESPAIQGVFSEIADTIDIIASALGGGSTAADGFRTALEDVAVGGTAYIRALGEQLVNLWRLALQIKIEAENALGTGAGEERDRNEALNAASEALGANRSYTTAAGVAGRVAGLQQAQWGLGVVPSGTVEEVRTLIESGQNQAAADIVNRVIDDIEAQRQSSGFRLGAQVESEQAVDAAFRQLATSVGRGDAGLTDANGNPLFTPRGGGADEDTGGDGGGGDGPAALADRLSSIMATVGRGKEDMPETPMLDGLLDDLRELPDAFIEFGAAGIWATDMIGAGFDEVDAKALRMQESAMAGKDAMIESAQALSAQLNDLKVAGFLALGDVASQSMSDIVSGSDEMAANFARNTLGAIGSMASSMGTMFILAGTAAQALPFLGLGGGAAIGAGIGLQVLGGALGGFKSMIGSGRSSGASFRVPEQSMRASSQARPIERTTVEATYIDTVVTADERTYRMLSGQIRRQDSLGAGGL